MCFRTQSCRETNTAGKVILEANSSVSGNFEGLIAFRQECLTSHYRYSLGILELTLILSHLTPSWRTTAGIEYCTREESFRAPEMPISGMEIFISWAPYTSVTRQ